MTPAEGHLSIEELHRLFRYEDGKLYNRITRSSRAVIGAEVGCTTGKGYLTVNINKRRYWVHRVIWAMHNGRWPEGKLVIDHIDTDNTNNKIENLREFSHLENCQNIYRKGYYKKRNKYYVDFRINKTRINGGSFNTEQEAYICALEKGIVKNNS